METLRDAVAVVTGAGSGIGRALAVALAAEGCALALADIDERGLTGTSALVANVRVTTSRVDVSKIDEMTSFRDEVERDFGRVSLLVNNAGVALYGNVDDVSIADLEWIVGINFWGAVYGTKLFLPLLRREPAANVVTISSLFGLIAPPLQSGYAASKFAVRGFSEVLRHELANTNVRVTVVHPGGIKTSIASSTRRGAHADEARYRTDTRAFERALVVSPEVAAARIVAAIRADKPRLLIGRDAYVLDIIQRFFPARYMQIVAPLIDPKKRKPISNA
ncbi:MAG: SDR family oxidoreductase [Candidatus Eremiobacteraeota bacterium]|nr:SDR family oxidoreductase [Candidatus Eremiobacteraeota bacterium]